MLSITFGTALDAYIQNREVVLSPATIREYKRVRKDHELLENKKLYNITQDDIQNHINVFSVQHSPKSVRNNHGLISAVMKMYKPNFSLNTVLPQRKRPKLYIPTDSDIIKVMDTAKGTEMEVPILLAAFGPMRRGEICALRSEDVEGNRVHVCRNMVEDQHKEWVIKSPKSYAGDRYIDFPE